MRCKANEVLLSGPAGSGKAQPLDAVVWTTKGAKRMGDVVVGDVAMTPDGGVTAIVAIHPQGDQDVYRLTFSDDSTAECTLDHLWALSYVGGKPKRVVECVRSLGEILPDYLQGVRERPKYWVPQTQPAAFPSRPVPIPAYTLGVLLGDGYLRKGEASFTSADPSIAAIIGAELDDRHKVVSDGGIQYRIARSASGKTRRVRAKRGYISFHKATGRYMGRARVPGGKGLYLGLFATREAAEASLAAYEGQTHGDEERPWGIWHELAQLGLEGKHSWDKFIPEVYKVNDRETRLAILQGLMDTDGTVDRVAGMPSYTSVSEALAKDVQGLLESLGGACTITTKQTTGRLAYTCWIRFNDNQTLFRLERKRQRCKVRTKYPVKRMLLKVENVGRKECQCITVGTVEGLYLTDRFIVTHNSRACLEKLHALASKCPGFRGLILRRTRESLSESALVTFEQHVVEAGHPILKAGGQRRMRQSYRYGNGSEIVVGGLDKPGKIMSTEYDAAYIQEAIEVEEDAWEAITTRLRNGKLPYQQLMADTNPGAPTHWLKKRCDAGRTVMINCRHEDNPVLHQHGQWTPRGLDYIARLDRLTGPRNMRLRHGRWVQAEGVVYEGWDPRVHLIDRFLIPLEWPRIWAVDFGYTNPFVALFFAQDPDGRLYLYREVYRTKTLVEDHARRLLALQMREAEEIGKAHKMDPVTVRKALQPLAVVCDHDAEDRATLTRHLGMGTTAARKDVRPGIEAVATRLRVQPDGKPRLFVLRDCLDGRDPALEESKRPCSIVEEMDCYVWNDKVSKDEPVKENDHSLDACRYACLRGAVLSEKDVPGFAPPAKMERPRPRLYSEMTPGRRLFPRKQ